MLKQYSYLKPRSQFGKQCVFNRTQPVAEEHIFPEPERMGNYIIRSHSSIATQESKQLAAHEAQTISKATRNTGMLHLEGGWPKEINSRDEEAVQRYRRRVEKDESWRPSMDNLMGLMERFLLQNNAVNIYDNFFNDMMPLNLGMEYHVRTNNVYEDPKENVRPVSQMSWCPGVSNRLAASYAYPLAEYEVSQLDVNLNSYIWDIGSALTGNPIRPFLTLKPPEPLMSIDFNPRDPAMLIGGLMTGQVCNWDIRTGSKPVQVSDLFHSHRSSVTRALWITSKTNTEFFSGSSSGSIKWWDIRNLSKPTDNLIMDVVEPSRGSETLAPGVSALHFEPAMGSRFTVGLQTGMVVCVNRRAATVQEKLSIRFDCQCGPVVGIDRNPFSTMNFLTVGDWSAKVWADDTREGCLLSTGNVSNEVSGGCWSRSRYSVFYTINTEGMLEVYDILTGVQAPLITFRVCPYALTTLAPHQDGQLIAIGSRTGSIYLVQCSEDLTENSKADKAALTAYFERSSRFQKMVDSRVKEIRVAIRPMVLPTIDSPERGRKGKDKRKDRGKSKEKIETKKKSKTRKIGKEAGLDGPEFVVAETEFFRIIDSEAAKFINLDEQDLEPAAQEMAARKKDRSKEGAGDPQKQLKLKKNGTGSKRQSASSKSLDEDVEERDEDSALEFDDTSQKSAKLKTPGGRRLRKVCDVKKCTPEICCKDMEDMRKPMKRADKSIEDESIVDKLERKKLDSKELKSNAVLAREKWYQKLAEYIDSIPERSAAYKRRLLIAKDAPPEVLREETSRAKQLMEDWQQKIIARGGGGEKGWKAKGDAREKEKREIRVEESIEESIDEVEDKADKSKPTRKRSSSGEKVKKWEEKEEDSEMRAEAADSLRKLDRAVAQFADQLTNKGFDEKNVYPRISDAFVQPIAEDAE